MTFRPATAADIAMLVPQRAPWRLRAIAAEADGRVIGIGGLVMRPDGAWASCVLTDEARRYKVAMHRAGLAVLDLARQAGLRRVLAKAEAGRESAAAWLLRLGFVCTGIDDVFVWSSDADVQ